jgi:hypothetical protein
VLGERHSVLGRVGASNPFLVCLDENSLNADGSSRAVPDCGECTDPLAQYTSMVLSTDLTKMRLTCVGVVSTDTI